MEKTAFSGWFFKVDFKAIDFRFKAVVNGGTDTVICLQRYELRILGILDYSIYGEKEELLLEGGTLLLGGAR